MKWNIISNNEFQNPKIQIQKIQRQLLKNRGLTKKKEIDEFLNPKLSQLNASFFDKKNLTRALNRIERALKQKELIIVYTDYDADGITGGAILWETLTELGAHTLPFVPDRFSEGYGLSKKGIDNLLRQHPETKLIITVDQGITKIDEVSYANRKGIDVIITDHHVLPETSPNAYAIVHTTDLSGSGVAYVFSKELIKKFKTEKKKDQSEKKHLALAALGTISDLVPLIGGNRAIAKFGLEAINNIKRIGLQALIQQAGLDKQKISTYEVGFLLGPRINAAGRLAHGLDAMRLLCTKDNARAKRLAGKLDELNSQRQETMNRAFEHAEVSVADENKLIFVAHESYHEGVIGLVAGKLMEKYYRPAIVLSKKETYAKASARSVKGFNIVEAIREAGDLLVDVGGHPAAAGFTVETEKIDKLRQKLAQIIEEKLEDKHLEKELAIDMELPLTLVTRKLYNAIEKLKPFGIGNREPVFAARKVHIQDARVVGKEGKHLLLTLKQVKQGQALPGAIRAIAFGMGELYPKLSPDRPVDIAYSISLNQWNRRENVQMRVRDICIYSSAAD